MDDDTISRQAAILAIEEYADRLQMVNWKENPGVPYKAYALNWAINTLRDLPSAERRGRWEAIDRDCRGYAITYECSSCKQLITLPYPMKWMDYDYCPNCGSFNGEGGENEEL